MMKSTKWNNISLNTISSGSGIYAWYYKPKLGTADTSRLIQELETLDSEFERKEYVKNFLNERLFKFFVQPDYSVKISGALMPKFSGCIQHIDQISEHLIARVLDDPSSINLIKDILSKLDINFLSPIYVGMAKNLSIRINSHKNLIESVKSKTDIDAVFDEQDRCFAERVVQRKMIETHLEVATFNIEQLKHEHNLAENIINRICFPILGRN